METHINATFLLTVSKIRHIPDAYCENHVYPKVKLTIVVGEKKHKVDELGPSEASQEHSYLKFTQATKIACRLYYKHGPGTALKDKVLVFTLHPLKGKPIKWKCNIADYYGRVLAAEETLFTKKPLNGHKPLIKFVIEDKSKDPLFIYKKPAAADDLEHEEDLKRSGNEIGGESPFQRRATSKIRPNSDSPASLRSGSMRLVAGEHLGVGPSLRRSDDFSDDIVYNSGPDSGDRLAVDSPVVKRSNQSEAPESRQESLPGPKPPAPSMPREPAAEPPSSPTATSSQAATESQPLLQSHNDDRPAKKGCFCWCG